MSTLPWLRLIGVMWVQSISGTNSDFAAYSPLLKQRLGINQVRLNILAFASDAGKIFAWLSGAAANHLPLWAVLVVGAAIGLIGYGVLYLFLVDKVPSLGYWQVVVLSMMGGNSICWVNTVCYLTMIQTFPGRLGTVVGLATSYVGLSAKIYLVISNAIQGKGRRSDESTSVYPLLNSLVPVVVGCVLALLLVDIRPMDSSGRGGFVALFVIAAVTGIYAMTSTIVPAFDTLPHWVNSTVLLLLVTSPVTVPLAKAWRGRERRCARPEVEASAADGTSSGVAGVAQCMDVEMGKGRRDEEVGGGGMASGGQEEYGVRRLVTCVDFWVYFMVYLCGATLGMAYLNQLGQISESRGLSEASTLLAISSSFTFFGRLTSAALDASTRRFISRPAIVLVLMIPMTGSFFLLLHPAVISLTISTAVLGLCTGAITSTAVSMTAELFGPNNFSINHNIVIVNIPLGSFLFGYLASILYDQGGNDVDVHGGGGKGKCLGSHCYNTTFLIWGSICSLGTMLSYVLYRRTRKHRVWSS